jgi:hypothetical protein
MRGFAVTTLEVWIYWNQAVCVDLLTPRSMRGISGTTLYVWIYGNHAVCVDLL